MVQQEKINPQRNSSLSGYNAWFFIPFFMWVVIGGGLQIFYTEKELFAFFNSHHTERMDILVPWITRMGEWIFITLLSLSPLLFNRFRNKQYVVMIMVVPLVVNLTNRLLKQIVDAPRPLSVYASENWVHHLDTWRYLYHHSFPSGHTAGAFSIFTLLAMILQGRNKIWGLHFFLLALCIAFSRMYLAVHFFADVYAGSIIGTSLTFMTLYFLERRFKKSAEPFS